MWESPIEILRTEIETQLEGEVLKAVQKIGVTVNKEELLKALKYDRDSYTKGYMDGCKNVDLFPEGEWITVDGFIHCSNCNHQAYWDTDYGQQRFDYCPYCGARMENGDEIN